MPHVASHANAHAVSHAHANARTHRHAEHAPASPFEELLEDVAAADQPAPPQAGELATALLPPQAEGDSKSANPQADPANATLSAPHAEIKAPLRPMRPSPRSSTPPSTGSPSSRMPSRRRPMRAAA